MIIIDTYKPKNEYIPTELRLKVSGFEDHPDMQVLYFRVPGEFAYQFTFYHTLLWQENTRKCCEDALSKIVSAMCSQSYDHGASWRDIKTEYLENESDVYHSTFKVNFYVRDAG